MCDVLKVYNCRRSEAARIPSDPALDSAVYVRRPNPGRAFAHSAMDSAVIPSTTTLPMKKLDFQKRVYDRVGAAHVRRQPSRLKTWISKRACTIAWVLRMFAVNPPD